MAYITRADIEAIYGAAFLERLLPDDVDPDTAVEKAAGIATSEAEAYLCKTYTVPLAEVPEALMASIVDLACYRLAATHDRLTEEITERAKMARAFLKDIASDKAGLGTAEPGAAPGAESPGENGASSPDGAFFISRPRNFRGLA